MHLTTIQINLLRLIERGNPDGTLIDLNQLVERAAHKPTKDSMQFSIRALIARDLIKKAGFENRRGRRRVLFELTPLGRHYVSPLSLIAGVVMEEADDELLSAIDLGELGAATSDDI